MAQTRIWAAPAVVLLGMALVPNWGHTQVMGDIDVIENLMENEGFEVTRSQDDAGDPMLSSRYKDVRFEIYFYDCPEASGRTGTALLMPKPDASPCASAQFSAGFDLAQGMSLQKINLWNHDRRYGKVYLDDESDPFLEYDINLGKDGVGAKNFIESITIWRQLLDDFTDFIDW